MQATKQQQIVGYFIEEAKEHLTTIEQGLLNLKITMADHDLMNEVFRAAHSVKGGAAMLGFNSIQKVAHHLEDQFKVLKETPIQTDRHVEDLFLKGLDTLKELLDALQSPYGLREEEAEQIVQAAEPTFVELDRYMTSLVSGKAPVQPVTPVTPTAVPIKSGPELVALVNGALKKMLELFKQGDSPTSRQQLTAFCGKLAQVHPCSEWKTLLQAVQAALANPKSTYPAIAPVVIKELKQAGELLGANRTTEIVVSQTLRQLAGVASTPAQPAVAAAPDPVLSVEAIAPGKPRQIMVPLEPRAAARVLLDSFNKQQLIELADFIMKAIQ